MHMDDINLQQLGSFDAILMDPPWRTAHSNPNYPSVSVAELVAIELCDVQVTDCSFLLGSLVAAH